MLTLGIITAVGGGIVRDVLLGALPPATFVDWRYLAVAAGGAFVAFLFSRRLRGLRISIQVLDAAGLSLFAVTGTGKALELGMGPAQAVLLGALTGVGGGTIRDVLIRRVPDVLRTGLYAVPALVAAALVVLTSRLGLDQVLGAPAALAAAGACFAIRMVGLRFHLNAPRPPGVPRRGPGRTR